MEGVMGEKGTPDCPHQDLVVERIMENLYIISCELCPCEVRTLAEDLDEAMRKFHHFVNEEGVCMSA